MAKDKDKIVSKAQNFLRRGQTDKAIKEYQAALALDKKDVRLYMKLGNLFEKKKENEKAIEYYLEAAKYLTKDGFYSRATAAYKQILQLDDSRVDITQQMADLYMKLGLNNEAMSYYQKISTHYEREGQLKEALEVVQRMLDLDPRNVLIATKLAELHYKMGNKDQGYEAFRIALDQLREEGKYEQYVKLLEKLAKADPENNENLKELAEIYTDHDRWDRAFAVLARVYQNDPEDTEALKQLGEAALKAGRPDDAVKYYKELASINKQKGLRQRAKDAMRKVLQIKPDDPEALALVGSDEPATLEEEPEEIEEVVEGPIEVLEEDTEEEILIDAGPAIEEEEQEAPVSLTPDQVMEHLTEAGVYMKYGLKDKALDHIRIVLRADPDNLQAHLRMKEVHAESGEMDKAIKELEFVATKGVQKNDPEAARQAVEEWLRMDPDNAKAKKINAKVQQMAPAAAEEEELIEEVESIEPEEELVEEAAVVEEPEEIELEEEEPEEIMMEEPEEEVLEEEPEEIMMEEEEFEEGPEEVMMEEEEPVMMEEEPEPPPAEPEPPPKAAGDFSEEMEEAEFYIQQGLMDEATKIYKDILAKDPENKDAKAKLYEISVAQPVEEVVISGGEPAPAFEQEEAPAPEPEPVMVEEEEPPPPEPEPEPVVAEEPPAPEPEPEPAVAEEPPAQPEVGTTAEPVVPEPPQPAAEPVVPEPPAPAPEPPAAPPQAAPPAPEPPQAAPPAPEPPAAPPQPEPPAPPQQQAPQPPPQQEQQAPQSPAPPPPAQEGFDLQGEVQAEAQGEKGWFVEPAEEPGGDLFGGDEDGDLFDLAAELEKDEDIFGSGAGLGLGAAEEFSFEETFNAFKKGVAETISEHDSSTHYDLGIAYREMGLTNDAVQEFLTAAKDPSRYGDCMVMAAMILREAGDIDHALDTAKQAVQADNLKASEKGVLFYEMAQALDAKGEKSKAKWAAQQGFSLNPDIPELDKMVASLTEVQPEPVPLGEGTGEAPPVPQEQQPQQTPPVQTGPPPSRDKTSWDEAAMNQGEESSESKDEEAEKKKKHKKISYV